MQQKSTDNAGASVVTHGLGIRSGKGENARQEILQAAAGMLRRNGYAEMSLRDVAAKVNKKAGSLYYHFPSKEHLATEVMRIGVQAVEDDVKGALNELQELDAETRLFTAIQVHLDALLRRSDFVSSHIRCYPFAPDGVRNDLREVRRGYDQLWIDLIADFLGPSSSKQDVHYVKHMLVGAMNQSVEWFNPNRDSIDDFARVLQRMLGRSP